MNSGLDEDGNIRGVTRCSHRTALVSGRQRAMNRGHGQPSFDKQFARDWLKANPGNDWTLPQEIVRQDDREIPAGV
ncbi:MAG: hypothetical protein ACLTSZ_09535 [Lachnospiraceae bacterium]